MGTDATRQGLFAARQSGSGPLLLARRVQAGAGEEAGAWRVDQRAWTRVHLLTALLSAVEQPLFTHTVKGRGEQSEN